MATESTRVEVRERRSFSTDEKRRIVGEYRQAIASGVGGGVVLRREGIYQLLVFKWGLQVDDGTLGTMLACAAFGIAPRSWRYHLQRTAGRLPPRASRATGLARRTHPAKLTPAEEQAVVSALIV